MNSSELDLRIEAGVVPDELGRLEAPGVVSFFQSADWLRLVSRVE